MGNPLFLVRREAAGVLIISGPEGEENRDTIRCQHCGAHWVPERGSGRVRGYCMRCQGVTCGAEPCERGCVPYEQMIERIEAAGRVEANIAEIRRTR